MVIAVDFDGTLCTNKYPKCGEPNKELFEALIKRQKSGDQIILWTCRGGYELLDAIRFCKMQGLTFDKINENTDDFVKKFGGDTRKICAHYYIDDKSLAPNEWADFLNNCTIAIPDVKDPSNKKRKTKPCKPGRLLDAETSKHLKNHSDLENLRKTWGIIKDYVETFNYSEDKSEKSESDAVNHPSHYTDGKIEVIDYIEDKGVGYHLGNVIKYVSRAGKKDANSEIQDLKKARWYLDRYISNLEKETSGKVTGKDD